MEHRCQTVLTALLAVGMLVLSSCSVQPSSPAHGSIPPLPFSVVSTGDSAVDMRDSSTLAQARQLHHGGERQPPENVLIDTLLQTAVIETLQAKGYRYSTLPGEGDLIVSYHVAHDEASTHREPVDTHDVQLLPSLNLNSPDPARYEKGTLVIEVTEKKTGLTAWRSALQGFAVRNLGNAKRRQRIDLMVDHMLAGVPAK